MTRIALFPGSFDPFTDGHEAIVRRALNVFDQVVVAIGINSDKQYLYSPYQRKTIVQERFKGDTRVSVVTYSDMTIECCHRNNATAIIRGVRNAKDLEYEQTVAAVNHKLAPEIETFLIPALPEHKGISSTLIREQLLHKK